jgi:hypothetical protein
LILCRECPIDCLIGLPRTGDVTQIAPLSRLPGYAGALGEGIDRGFIETLAGSPSAMAKSVVESRRNPPNRILHAFSIGTACTRCKRSLSPSRLSRRKFSMLSYVMVRALSGFH